MPPEQQHKARCHSASATGSEPQLSHAAELRSCRLPAPGSPAEERSPSGAAPGLKPVP